MHKKCIYIYIYIFDNLKSKAVWISARAAVEEVVAPVVGLAGLNVVATWLLRERCNVLRRPEVVGTPNNLA